MLDSFFLNVALSSPIVLYTARRNQAAFPTFCLEIFSGLLFTSSAFYFPPSSLLFRTSSLQSAAPCSSLAPSLLRTHWRCRQCPCFYQQPIHASPGLFHPLSQKCQTITEFQSTCTCSGICCTQVTGFVFVSSGCYNRVSQTGRLEKTEIDSLTVLEAGILKLGRVLAGLRPHLALIWPGLGSSALVLAVGRFRLPWQWDPDPRFLSAFSWAARSSPRSHAFLSPQPLCLHTTAAATSFSRSDSWTFFCHQPGNALILKGPAVGSGPPGECSSAPLIRDHELHPQKLMAAPS